MDPEIIRRAQEELRTLGYVTEETRKAMEELTKAQKIGKEIFALLFNTTKAYTKEMYSGQQGAAAFNSSIDAASNSLQKWLRLIPIVGDELADIAGAASGATKELNLLSDRLFTTYQALSKFGLAASDGMSGVAEAAQRLGYGLDEVGLQNFTKLMADSSVTLARLGGSAVEGRKRFLELATIVRTSAGTELRMLGLSVEEINETTADYIGMQTRLGFAQTMSTEQMRKGAVEFARELDILAKLTGEQKEQLRSQMEQAQNEQRFRARLELLRRQGDTVTAKNIQFLNATVAKEAPTLSKGLRDIIAAGGAITSDEAAMAMQATEGRIQDIAQRALRGEDYVGLFNELAAATGKGTERFLEVAAQTDMSGVFGDLAQNMNLSNRYIDREGKLRDRLTGELVKQVDEADPAVKAQVDLRTSQMNARDSLQSFVKLGVNPATRALQQLADIPEAAAGALPGETAGGAMPGGGGVVGAIKRFFGGSTAEPAAGGRVSQQDLERMGLRIKTGDVQAEGATVDPRTLQLAQAVQNSIQGFNYFSGFNDRFHQENAPSSTHTKGAAFDFTLASPPTKEQGAQIVKNLMAMGAVKAIDEYNNPSRGSTGGHFHVQAFAKGGITQGPSIAGEAGPEAVVPLPDGKSIPVKIDKSISAKRDDLADAKNTLNNFTDSYERFATATIRKDSPSALKEDFEYGRLKAKDVQEIRFGGISSHGAVNMGPLSTDTKLTDMIMQRLGLEDLRSKVMINQSGIGMNYNIAGADFGSRIGGGLAQGEITERVAALVEEGIPLQGALQQTLKEFQAALQELVKASQKGEATEGEGMMKLMLDLVDLQRQQNATSRQMLQVATN